MWYVDDCKVSHKDATVVTEIINKLKEHFGELQTSRGSTLTFLGIDIEIQKCGKILLSMKDQILETIELFGEKDIGTAATPAKLYLFDVRDDAEALDTNRAHVFHSVVAKLLYIMKRVHPDIETAISFLTTRVSCCTVDDWQKLERVNN